jgi:hypothetical protein
VRTAFKTGLLVTDTSNPLKRVFCHATHPKIDTGKAISYFRSGPRLSGRSLLLSRSVGFPRGTITI